MNVTGLSVLAIDPGPPRSAWAVAHDGAFSAATEHNDTILGSVIPTPGAEASEGSIVLAVEDVQCMGMVAGKSLFRTAQWSGRFIQAWSGRHVLIPRTTVKLAMCGTTRAKDPNVRQAVIDRLGEPPTRKRRNPRLLIRPAKDQWSAIAIALTYLQLASEGRLGELETLDAATSEET